MLAFACAFTMFAGAAFTDDADINADNREAVELLTALNIIQGYEDGSFDPEGVVTRAEMAKMIYTIRNGGNDDASAYETVTTTFTDINGHWAEGYIKYLQNTGIVAGKSATKFDPNSQVTTGEAMKMALVLAGYDAEHAGLTGTAWLNNTVARATTVGMTKDVQSSIAGGCTRQDAAQILANTLTDVEAVLWSEFVSDFVYDGLNGMATGDRQDVGMKWMDLDTHEDVLLTSVKQEKGRSTYEVTVIDNRTPVKYTRVATDYSDLIGMYVNVLHEYQENDKVYGVYADEDSSIIATGVVGKLALDSAATDSKIKLDGTSYDLDDDADETLVYVVNKDTASRYLDDLTNDISTDNSDAWSVKLIDVDGDGDVNHAFVTKTNIGKVTYMNSSMIRVDVAGASGNEEYDLDDDDIYEDVARDDWVVIVDDGCTVGGNFVITEAESVTGVVQSVRDSSREVRIDGTWYEAASAYTDNMPAVGNNVTLVIHGGMFYDVSGASTSIDVAAVTGIGTYNRMDDTLSVRLMFRDGTEEVVEVEKWVVDSDTSYTGQDLDTNATGGTIKDDVLVEYDVSGGKYTLTMVQDRVNLSTSASNYPGVKQTAATGDGYDASRDSITIAGTEYDVDNGAMIVIKSDDDYLSMTGEELLALDDFGFSASTTVYAVLDGSKVIALFAQTTESVMSSTKTYGYIVNAWRQRSTDGDNNTLWVDIIVDGEGLLEDQETTEAVNATNANDWAGKIVTYTLDDDGIMTIDEVTGTDFGAVDSRTNNSVYITPNGEASTDRYMVTDDTTIIVIDGVGDDATYAGDNISAISANEVNGTKLKNVLYKSNGSKELEVIIVQIDSKAASQFS